MNHLGIPVFEFAINWVERVNRKWTLDTRESTLGFGPEILDPQMPHVVTAYDFELQVRNEEIPELDSFMDALKGRGGVFWLPGPAAAFKLSSGSLGSFVVLEQGAEESWELNPNAYVIFQKHGETSHVSKIISVVDNGDDTETVTIQPAVEAVDETWQMFPLVLVRMAEDTEKIDIRAERWQGRVIRVVELPNDYTLLPTQRLVREPVFLYKFTAPLRDGDIIWRYTSHATDVTIENDQLQSSSSSSDSQSVSSSSSSSKSSASFPGESSLSSSSSSSSSDSRTSASSLSSSSSSSDEITEDVWISAAIEHSGLKRSNKSGGTVTITGDYDTIEPLRLSLPARIPAQLKLEILQTDTSFREPRTIFNGIVKKPEDKGRKVKANCAEWGNVMENETPAFYLQPNCNYQVYETSTCRADLASKQVAVTIKAIRGRNITVSGNGVAGKALDWFSLGKLEFGTGLNRRVVNVLRSSAASGIESVLVVNEQLTEETPIAATLTPGCDGRRSTCIVKFNNLVNFGGHITPQDSLALSAIKQDIAPGGKK